MLTTFAQDKAEFSCKPSAENSFYAEAQPKSPRFSEKNAEVAQLVERRLPKPKVAGSKPVFRSNTFKSVPRGNGLVLFTKASLQ